MPAPIKTDGKKFAADLAGLARELGIEVSTVIKKVTIDVWGRVTELTPVDTGRARASWHITDSPGNDKPEEPGTYGPPLLPRHVPNADILYIVNGLPYIGKLNDGWSDKAPAGFVEMAVAEVLAEADAELEQRLLEKERG